MVSRHRTHDADATHDAPRCADQFGCADVNQIGRGARVCGATKRELFRKKISNGRLNCVTFITTWTTLLTSKFY
jgi:hypothetical protein